MDRSTVYRLLKEHGLQDLHRVLTAAPAPDATPDSAPATDESPAKKGGLEVVPCAEALSLTLLNPLDVAGTAAALTPFNVAAADDRYTDQALQTSLLFLTAFGVTRLAHVNDQPVAEWGPVLDTPRRPDADTLAQYLQAIQAQELVVAESPAGVVAESPAPAAAET